MYKVSGARVNAANPRFNSVDFPYELILEKYSTTEELPEDGSIMIRAFNFVKLADIESSVGIGKQVDLAGIIAVIGPLDRYQPIRKDPAKPEEGMKMKRTITIFDDSLHSIELTVYDSLAL